MTRFALAMAFALMASTAQAQPICVCLKCVGPDFDRFAIVAGSMKPALLPDQCIITRNRFRRDELRPGTIVAFRHPINSAAYIKRIVATEGQQVQMIDGRLHINGQAVRTQPVADYEEPMERQGPQNLFPVCANGPVQVGQTCQKGQALETLGGQTYPILDLGDRPLDNTPAVTVPTGHVFVMGDNRDNSSDSRIALASGGVGPVAITDIIGLLDEVRP